MNTGESTRSARASTAAIAAAKAAVWSWWSPVRDTGSIDLVDPAVLDDQVEFFGPAPVGELSGRAGVVDGWLRRIGRAFPEVERHAYLFLGGDFDGSTWVAETGEWRGVMRGDFCGVPATGRLERLRYGAFHRVEGERIVEMRVLVDLLALAASAGYRLLPDFAARAELPPAPALGPIVASSMGVVDPAETAATLRLVEDMLGGCNRLADGDLASMGMHAFWHEDMCWYGPWGVGSTIGFDEFQRWAQGPSVASFPNRRGGFHRARFADGLTACFTGWPSLRGTFDGSPFRGIEPTGGEIGQNIMDFYVRRGDRLHENWVLIDLVDFAAQCGVDLLAELPGER